MTDFLITAPDGRKFKVSGDSQEGAVAALKKMLGGAQSTEQPTEQKSGPKVIATTPDGGTIYQMENGTRAFKNADYATSDPAKIDEIMKGATPARVSTSGFDQSTIGQHPIASRAAKALQGVPFAGQWADEAIGVFSQTAQNAMRASQDAMGRENPKQSFALQIGGGLAGSVPMALAAAPSIIAAAPTTLATQVAAGVGAGSFAGATEGLVSGAGAGNDGNRMDSAIQGGTTGAILGGIAGGAAPAIGAGIRALVERAKGLDTTAIRQTLGIGKDAARALKPDLAALDFRSAARNISVAGPDAMLADAGLPMREALDAAITGGGKAARIGIDAVSQRAAVAGRKLSSVMDAVLGAPHGTKAAAKSISIRTAPMRAKAYETAYSTAINYADDTGRAIKGVLLRVPPKTLTAAISEANDAMRAAGIMNKQIMPKIFSDGSVSFHEMPNVQQLDELKKALGTIAQKETDPITGRITAAGVRANSLARDLKTAVADAVPSYKTAVKLGGDKIAEDRALDMGRKLFSASTTRETVAETMRGASIEAQAASRQGVREYLDDVLARVRRSIDDPSADTQETLKLLNTLSSRDAREKLALVLGESKSARLLSEIDAAGKQFSTRQAIATGSATGRREARSRALDSILAPGPVQSAAKGRPIDAFRAVVSFLTRATPEADLAKRQAVLADIAKALTTQRGAAAQNALTIIQKAIEGQPIKSADALRIGRLVAGSSALAAYQTGTQYLSSQIGGK